MNGFRVKLGVSVTKKGFMIILKITKRTDYRLLERMANHYSKPKGFVGRNICYAITDELGNYYGHIVAGSATLHLKGRHEFLNTSRKDLNNIVNNVFFNCKPVESKYPTRNFTSKVVKLFCETVSKDWYDKYGDRVLGFETLVEAPRTGELYLRAGFTLVGETVGYTCKRISGVGTDNWTGKRVWDTENLRPKIILCKINKNPSDDSGTSEGSESDVE